MENNRTNKDGSSHKEIRDSGVTKNIITKTAPPPPPPKKSS